MSVYIGSYSGHRPYSVSRPFLSVGKYIGEVIVLIIKQELAVFTFLNELLWCDYKKNINVSNAQPFFFKIQTVPKSTGVNESGLENVDKKEREQNKSSVFDEMRIKRRGPLLPFPLH